MRALRIIKVAILGVVGLRSVDPAGVLSWPPPTFRSSTIMERPRRGGVLLSSVEWVGSSFSSSGGGG